MELFLAGIGKAMQHQNKDNNRNSNHFHYHLISYHTSVGNNRVLLKHDSGFLWYTLWNNRENVTIRLFWYLEKIWNNLLQVHELARVEKGRKNKELGRSEQHMIIASQARPGHF